MHSYNEQQYLQFTPLVIVVVIRIHQSPEHSVILRILWYYITWIIWYYTVWINNKITVDKLQKTHAI